MEVGMAEKVITESSQELSTIAADLVVKGLREAIKSHGSATWVIAGGTAPMGAYRIIAANSVNALDWSKVQIVTGDERCVPFDSPDNNWTQAENALLKYLPLANQIGRPITGQLSAEEVSEQYETALRKLPENSQGIPRLDQVWLGVGEDGHTLSLFPSHPSLASTDRLVIPVHNSPKPPPDRISLTLRALRGTVQCLILAVGAGKVSAVQQALAGDTSLPIALAVREIESAGGKVTWLLDRAAAGTA